MQPAAGVTPAGGPAADVLGYNTGLVRRSTGTEVTEEQDHRVSAGSTPESRADNSVCSMAIVVRDASASTLAFVTSHSNSGDLG